ncbi:hypothetical protein AbraIFM66950_001568 [Aspergillus brasiliensis]|nr:hypothetical protein AbraIFM66950_001568 [Aspergillus brasiliensis]
MTTDSVYDTNIRRMAFRDNMDLLSDDQDFPFAHIANAMVAEAEVRYQECLLGLASQAPIFAPLQALPVEDKALLSEIHKLTGRITTHSLLCTCIVTSPDYYMVAESVYWQLRESRSCVVYYTFDTQGSEDTPCTSFMISIIRQILGQSLLKLGGVPELLDAIEKHGAWAYHPIFSLLKTVLRSLGTGQIYLVLVDLYRCSASIAQLLHDMLYKGEELGWAGTIEAFTFTFTGDRSTDDQVILRPDVPSVCLDTSDHVLSNLPYYRGKVLAELRETERFDPVLDDLVEAVNNCSNCFQLASIVEFTTQHQAGTLRTVQSLSSSIKALPLGIEDVVTLTYNRLPCWAKCALGWLIHAKRPLLLNELAIAITFYGPDGCRIATTLDGKSLPLNLAAQLKHVFGPVLCLKDGNVVFSSNQVQSVFQRLTEKDNYDQPQGHDSHGRAIPGHGEITRSLLDYLSSPEILNQARNQSSSKSWLRSTGEIYDLVNYATRWWPGHLCHMISDVEVEVAYKLIEGATGITGFGIWLEEIKGLMGTAEFDHINPFLIAARYGLDAIVQRDSDAADESLRGAALALASWGGHIDIVKALLSSGVDRNSAQFKQAARHAAVLAHQDILELLLAQLDDSAAADRYGEVICLATELGHESLVNFLIQRGAMVEITNGETTPLQVAARMGHESIVSLLLSCGADPDSTVWPDTRIPLLHASKNGFTNIVKSILNRQPPADILVMDGEEQSPLHLAAHHNHPDILALLLDYLPIDNLQARSIINAVNLSGQTPLILASRNGCQASVDLLLAKGANVSLPDHDGHTALYYAVAGHHEEPALKILDTATEEEPLQDLPSVCLKAARFGFDRVVEACLALQGGREVKELTEYRDENGWTALHYGAAHGHKMVVDILLRSEVPINLPTNDWDNRTPLRIASLGGKADVVELLISKGADVHEKSREGMGIVAEVCWENHIEAGHVRVVDLLLQAKVDPNVRDTRGWEQCALHYAAMVGHLSMVESLLRYGGDPNGQDNDGDSPLHYAARDGYAEVARVLLSHGSEPLSANNATDTAMHLAAQNGAIDVMEVLQQRERSAISSINYMGRNPLHHAATAPAAAWLIDHGADVDATDTEGRTALMLASEQGNEKLVTLLLSRNANPRAQTKTRQTALHYAMAQADPRIPHALLEKDHSLANCQDVVGRTPVHAALSASKTTLVTEVLKGPYGSHINLDIQDNEGNTALMVAIHEQDGKELEDLVRLLLDHGADPMIRNKSDQTSLLILIRSEKRDILSIFFDHPLQKPVDINDGGDDTPTPLYAACEEGEIDLVKELIEKYGADVNALGGKYRTALGVSAQGGYYQQVAYLLDQGADVSIHAGPFWANALSAALSSRLVAIAEFLVEKGAPIDAVGSLGQSAVHLAGWGGTLELLELLRAKGGNMTATDEQGRTLLHHAAASGNLEIVERFHDDTTLNIDDSDGWSPLHWACRQSDNQDIVRILLDAGADPTKPTVDGWTPRDICIFHDTSELLPLFPEPDAKEGSDKMAEMGEFHIGYHCDGCYLMLIQPSGQPLLKRIYGIRWKCETCRDFDYCFKCYWSAAQTHPDHLFKPNGKGPTRGPKWEKDSDAEGSSSFGDSGESGD